MLTTLVPRVQAAARDALGDLQGAVVAIDPSNGDVLAMYSNPGYDPQPLSSGTPAEMEAAWTKLTEDPNTPLVAHAFQDLYLPGSTFKTVTASAALEHGWGPLEDLAQPAPPRAARHRRAHRELRRRVLQRRREDRDDGQGVRGFVQRAVRRDRDGAEGRAHGRARRRRTASAGPNPQFSLVVPERDDPVRAARGRSGISPTPSYFENNEAALARSAIGLDNDLTNPLHLALIASAIANQGTMYEPRLVTEVRDATTGQTIATFAPEEFSHPLTADSAAQLRAMMVDVVKYGTGYCGADPRRGGCRQDGHRHQRRGHTPRTRGSPRSRPPDRARPHASP